MRTLVVAAALLALPSLAHAADATPTPTPEATATPAPTPQTVTGEGSAVGGSGGFSNAAPRGRHDADRRGDDVDTSGFFLAFDLGGHRPTGSFYDDNLEGGFAFNLRAGWRFARPFSLETGIYEGVSHVKGTTGGNAATAEVATIDARFYPLPEGTFEPNILLGYTFAAGATAKQGSTTTTFAGGSTNLGIGVRWTIAPMVFLDADYRHMFIRLTKERISGAGGGLDGTFNLPRQYHGDDDAFLVGGGIQF